MTKDTCKWRALGPVAVMFAASGGLTPTPFMAPAQANVAEYVEACNNDYADACYNLGVLYYDGEGVYQDKDKARKLFVKACNGNTAEACFNLAAIYYNGDDVPQDLSKARFYVDKAVAIEPSWNKARNLQKTIVGY